MCGANTPVLPVDYTEKRLQPGIMKGALCRVPLDDIIEHCSTPAVSLSPPPIHLHCLGLLLENHSLSRREAPNSSEPVNTVII
jgi:hypothetical protein